MAFKTGIEAWEALTEIFHDVFDDEGIELSPDTTAADIEEWDSLTNIQLLVAIEQKFGIRFASGEVADIPNVGALINLILKRTSGR